MYEKKVNELLKALETLEGIDNFVRLCGSTTAKGSYESQAVAHVYRAVQTGKQVVKAELERVRETELV